MFKLTYNNKVAKGDFFNWPNNFKNKPKIYFPIVNSLKALTFFAKFGLNLQNGPML